MKGIMPDGDHAPGLKKGREGMDAVVLI